MRLALLLWLAAASAAVALEPPPPYFEDAAQDRAGCLWAFSRAEYGRVYRFDGRQWEEQAAPADALAHAMPAKVAVMADGSVACLWRIDDQTLAVTRHLGREKARLVGTCAGRIEGSGLQTTPLADSHNRLWITGKFPQVYRVDDAGVHLAHEVTPEELDAPKLAKQGYNEIQAVEDGLGRVWVWSGPMASNWATLRGVLVLDGEKAERRDPCATLKKGAKILTLARADERHLWMSVRSDGVYRLDVESLALERLPDPAPDALCCVHEMFVAGSDLYAVEHDTGAPASPPEILWRWRDGTWQQVLPELDTHFNAWYSRPWLPVNEGLLVGAYAAGPWFIPRQGPPAPLSWRSGFPVEDVRTLTRLPDGTFFAIGHSAKIFHGALSLPPRDQENPRIVPVNSESGWTPDADGRPWIVLRDSPGALSGWDGEKWAAYPIPGAEKMFRVTTPLADAEGRLWVDTSNGERKTHVLDTRTGQWRNFADTQTAYLELRDHPPHFPPNPLFAVDPQYGADGRRIAFRRDVGSILYYDGAAWQRFERRQITGKTDDSALGPPWFDADGRLCVNLRDKTTRRRSDDGQWSEVPFQSRFPTDIWSENSGNNRAVHPEPPEGCVTAEPDSIVQDNLGTYWLTWQGELYRAVPGHCAKVFVPGESSPFHTERKMRAVYVDNRGNALLGTTMAGTQNFLLKPRSAPPRTTVAVVPIAADAVQVRFKVESALPVETRWQLDDGPWQVSRDNPLTLSGLANGKHRLRATSHDAELQAEGRPAETAFEIRIDPARQIADLVAGLADPDYARRKSSVDALALQPDLAVPALRAARQTADADRRWWIDATLGQIERTRNIPPPSPEKNP